MIFERAAVLLSQIRSSRASKSYRHKQRWPPWNLFYPLASARLLAWVPWWCHLEPGGAAGARSLASVVHRHKYCMRTKGRSRCVQAFELLFWGNSQLQLATRGRLTQAAGGERGFTSSIFMYTSEELPVEMSGGGGAGLVRLQRCVTVTWSQCLMQGKGAAKAPASAVGSTCSCPV